MTIAIKITNSDSRETAIIRVSTISRQGKSLLPESTGSYELKGGESKELYIHDNLGLVVEEVQNG